jgi:glycosyltransferase involved in cell wall biosynthesis
MLQETGLSRHYTPWAYRHADLVITNSARARAEILQVLGLDKDAVLFIPNGVDPNRFSPVDEQERMTLRRKLGWDESQRIVLTVANYKVQKNYPGIVQALEGLDLSSSSLRFYWAGVLTPEDEFTRVAEQIEQAQLGNFIQIMGERNDVADLYRACDLVLLNSLWEGTPNVVLEAMSCGRPVIATDVSDVSVYVRSGENGWLIQPNDSSALREVLHAVSQLGKPELDRLGLQGYHHLSNLGMDPVSLGERHEKVYLELLK